ncbi:MAG: hypothetical protein IKJ31_04975 [Bacteroidaceae bacterium]|nr:hypothetical protein [Bacteroidaceae bacterium]
MAQPKFIITGEGVLRLGLVNRHRELLKPGESCLGGGYYELDYISHRMLLSGMSTDYGEPEWDVLDELTVSAYYRGLTIIYSSWENWKDAFPVSERISIVYV